MKQLAKARNLAKALVTGNLEFEFDKMPFCIENVPKSKLLSTSRSELNAAMPTPGEPWYPVQLQVEVSSSCMLKCPVCPAADGATGRPHRRLPLRMFESLMEEVGDHVLIAVLWMWGEPLINTHLPEMIALAHQKKVATLTSTNGQLIQTEEEAERLVSSGLDNLVIALDGATQETYARYRIGGDIQKVFRCIDLVCRAKRSLGITTPWVTVRTVVNRQNEPELNEIEKIARRYGADMVARKTMGVCNLSGPDALKDLLPSNPLYIRPEIKDGRVQEKSVDDLHCVRPWTRMTVNSGGVVLPCEFDFDEVEAFGRGGDGHSFLEAWRGEKASDFRRRFGARKSQYSFCANCAYKDGGSTDCTVEAKALDSRILQTT